MSLFLKIWLKVRIIKSGIYWNNATFVRQPIEYLSKTIYGLKVVRLLR